MTAKKKAMKSEDASLKKIGGHINESDFAEIVGVGLPTSQTDKKDVVDCDGKIHSIKGGTWWQVFLYSRERFLNDPIFQGLGDLSDIFVQCIDAFPVDRKEHLANKELAKKRLQVAMKRLCRELQNANLAKALFSKSFFNGGEVDYLTIVPAFMNEKPKNEKLFHVFHQEDVIAVLHTLHIENSRRRAKNQFDDQKVLFRTTKNVGEIEMRNDSDTHYRKVKFRINGTQILDMLLDKHNQEDSVPMRTEPYPQVFAYGKATRTFIDRRSINSRK